MAIDEREAMLEPDVTWATLALERQRVQLVHVLARLDHVRNTVMPMTPTHEWKGFAQAGYERRLRTLHEQFTAAIATVEQARDNTNTAIARLETSV